MNITVNGNDYELRTKLRTIQKIENEFNASVDAIFRMLDSARTGELIKLILIAAGTEKGDTRLRDDLLEDWDYMDLVFAVRELLAQMLFSGTPEQQEKKIGKFSQDETVKNGIREMLGLSTKPSTEPTDDSTGNEL